MAIDFNTPKTNFDPSSELSPKPHPKVYFSHPERIRVLVLSVTLILSIVSALMSSYSISRIYKPKPIIVQCDPSVVENVRQISEKMNKISLDKDEK
jgi:hypothetical protein